MNRPLHASWPVPVVCAFLFSVCFFISFYVCCFSFYQKGRSLRRQTQLVHRRLIANKILIWKGIALIPGVNCLRDFHFYSTGTLCISARKSIAVRIRKRPRKKEWMMRLSFDILARWRPNRDRKLKFSEGWIRSWKFQFTSSLLYNRSSPLIFTY